MSGPSERDVRQQKPELVFAVVGALGADLGRVTDTLSDNLELVGYRPELVRLSELMRDLPRWRALPTNPLDSQVEQHQSAGNTLREIANDKSAVVLLGIADIRRRRLPMKGRNLPQAFIIRSLKRPEEIHTLRSVYGTALFVIAAHAPLSTRVETLSHQIARSRASGDADRFRERAEELIERDAAELDTSFGQNLRMTFPEADVIVDASQAEDLRKQVARVVRIIFSAPFETPTISEFAMFHAKAAALRSADLGRQVGAAIVNADGDVIAVGANEVPRAGGGLYWPDASPDGRDFTRPRNDSQSRRRETLAEVFKELKSRGWINPRRIRGTARTDERIVNELSRELKDTRLMNLGEFGRSVHAEMAALLDAARRGVSVKDADLYSSTFPCHNCAKHIVAAGIARVHFIEPYPESLATELHDDSLVVDPTEKSIAGGKCLVRFETFVGVAPRRYFEFFSKLGRKDEHGEALKWQHEGATPRPEIWASAPELAKFAVLSSFGATLRKTGLLEGGRSGGVRKKPSSGTHRKRSGSTKR